MTRASRTTVSDLFTPEPEQWGLRGDPVLWAMLKQRFAGQPIPERPDDLIDLVDGAFRGIVGASMLVVDEAEVDSLHAGGMSSGMVYGAFWRDVAVPMLVARFLLEADHPSVLETQESAIKYRRRASAMR